MFRTQGANNSSGQYVNGPPATVIEAEHMNTIQEEICSVIEAAGLQVREKANNVNTQLLAAIRDYFANRTESVEIVTANKTMVANMIYLVNSTARISLTLPPNSGIGTTITVVDIGGGGYEILQTSMHNIFYMNRSTTYGATGKIWSKTGRSSIKLLCLVANSSWQAIEIRDQYTMKGYIMGGTTGARVAVIEDLNFALETSTTIAATLDTAKDQVCGVSGSLKGYTMGGNTGAVTDVIEDLNFALETSATIVATLDTAKGAGSGVSGSLKGYIMGGTGSSTVIEYLNFALEISAAIAAALGTGKDTAAGVNSNLKGYMMGGSGTTDIIQDLNFALETSTTIAATLDTAKYSETGVSGSLKGYIMGGFTGANTDVIEDLNFALETSAAIAATLDTAKRGGAGVSGSLKGYCMGGFIAAVTAVIEDLNFALETSAAIAATLDTAKQSATGVQGYN